MKRALATLGLFLAGYGSALAGSLPLLGAGAGGAAPVANCSAFLPANFATSALYISWTTADGLGSFGMACLNGTTAVAASTLGTFVQGAGSSAAGASGLTTSGGGFFQFTNVTWIANGDATIFQDFTFNTTGGTQALLSLNDGTANNLFVIRLAASTLRGQIASGGVSLGQPNTALTAATSTAYRMALSTTSGTQIVCVNGANNATTVNPGTLASLSAANISATVGGANTASITVRQTAFFATALASAAACDTLTT